RRRPGQMAQPEGLGHLGPLAHPVGPARHPAALARPAELAPRQLARPGQSAHQAGQEALVARRAFRRVPAPSRSRRVAVRRPEDG
ncbi:MAG: hypothetical protein QNJ94_23795, partial [Alphaproteobacteria bacterium]|nr:hypothetical protein [Alphaproteobacteria bacterium]